MPNNTAPSRAMVNREMHESALQVQVWFRRNIGFSLNVVSRLQQFATLTPSRLLHEMYSRRGRFRAGNPADKGNPDRGKTLPLRGTSSL